MYVGTFAVVSLMVGDVIKRYVDDNPSMCEVVTYINGTNGTDVITVVTELEILDCPKVLEVVVALTFLTGLIMVREWQCVYSDTYICSLVVQVFMLVINAINYISVTPICGSTLKGNVFLNWRCTDHQHSPIFLRWLLILSVVCFCICKWSPLRALWTWNEFTICHTKTWIDLCSGLQTIWDVFNKPLCWNVNFDITDA